MTLSLKDSTWIKTIPDYPKPGVNFYDITPLLKNDLAFHHHINMMSEEFLQKELGKRISAVAGVEARGFILGAAIAYRLGVGFIPIRKAGKLPRHRFTQDYELEYGPDTLEIHSDAAFVGESILIVDDVLATGGTADAAIQLFRRAGAKIVGFSFLIELIGLDGRERLKDTGVSINVCESFEV